MVLEGTVRNGEVVLDERLALPEGTRVEVVIKKCGSACSSVGEVLLRHAGRAVGLPEDMAAQHDHYLHGTPRR